MATISFAGSGGYAGPFEGAGSELLPFQGYTFGKISKVTEGTAKESKNATLKLEIICEEKGAEGMRLQKVQPVTGMRSDKKPNVQGLLDILFSVYSGIEATQDAAMARVRALEGQELDSAGIVQELTGQRVWIDVNARKYTRDDGTDGWSSDIRNFVGKKRYEDALGANIHHRKNPDEAMAAPKANSSTGSPVTASGGDAGKASARKVL